MAVQVCVPQESTMGPWTVPPETASFDDEDNISDDDDHDSKDKINSKFDNRSPKCVNNGI